MMQLPAGTYYPGESFLHRLDPRAKLLCLMALVTALVLTDTLPGYGLSLVAVTILTIASGLPASVALGSLGRLGWFFLTIFLMNALFYGGGEPYFQWWIIQPSLSGILQGLQVVARVGMILVIGNVLMAVTRPMDTTKALNWLFSPLGRIGIPVEEAAMIISVAIQFLPTLMEETDTIQKAQTARGARFESKRLTQRAASLLPMIVPVFLSAFKRADELSMAMEARGYRDARHRTRYAAARLQLRDYGAVGVCIGLCILQAIR